MELFIDSASVAEIEKYFELEIFSGVTTTPTFFLKNGAAEYGNEIKKIVELASGNVHLEAMGKTAEEIVTSANANARLHPLIVSKIPFNAEGIKAVHRLAGMNVKTNMHLVFSLNQAVLAAQAGADYVCPLLGRLNDIGEDALRVVGDIVETFRKYGFKTKVMASSIRSPKDVSESFLRGTDAVTIPPRIIDTMIFHPLTERGIDLFEKDAYLLGAVEGIMKRGDEMPFVAEGDTLVEALGVMTEKKIGLCIVVDGAKKMKGIITDGDVRRILKTSKSSIDAKAGSVMNPAPKTVPLGTRVCDALALMELERITTLVIVTESLEPVGYLNLHDLLAKTRR